MNVTHLLIAGAHQKAPFDQIIEVEPEGRWAISGLMTPALVRAAREILGWNTETLAGAAEVSVNTVNRYQNVRGDETDITITVGSAKKIRHALEAAGIEFVNDRRRCGVVLVKPE